MPRPSESSAERDAVALLQHYFALAMGKRSARDLSSDARTEIAEIVHRIVDAAVLAAKE